MGYIQRFRQFVGYSIVLVFWSLRFTGYIQTQSFRGYIKKFKRQIQRDLYKEFS